ncbi:MAG: CDP-diacylglycerol--glycerol-3-phosphate 3-phosphatidyltransferase [Methylotenera sp.]|nr:CDP-diacylglycerol--glycerol-3-phosphate 3-phosphatidyltransferase [Oligoflexia bacterium]
MSNSVIDPPKPFPQNAASPDGHDPHDSGDSHDKELNFTNTPNLLTLSRMLFVPVVVTCLFVKTPKWDLIAALLFGVASITDYFDGYIARRQKLETVYGKLMDPLADKFLVVSALIMLQELGRIHPVVVILLICREMAITGLRALASAEGLVIGASASAKWKTAAQMVAIPCLMVKQGLFGIPLYPIGMALLYISLAISLWSAQDYIVDFFRAVKVKRREKVEARKLQKLQKLQKKLEKKARRSSRNSPRNRS